MVNRVANKRLTILRMIKGIFSMSFVFVKQMSCLVRRYSKLNLDCLPEFLILEVVL